LLGTENQANSMQFLFTLPLLPVLTYVICLNFETKDRILSAFLLVVGCGGIYTIYTSFFFVRAYGITEGANSSAVVLAAGLILFLWRLIASKKRTQRRNYAFIAIVLFWAIFLTGSRTGYITLAAAVLCMFFLIRQNKKLIISTIVLLVIFTLPITQETHQFQRIVSAIEVITEGESNRSGSRTVLRRALADRVAYEMFLDSPIFGIGIGKSKDNIILYSQLLSKSHNSYALLLSETGLIGLALYLLYLFKIFVLINNMRKEEQRIWPPTLTGRYHLYVIFPNFLMVGYIAILVSAYFWPVFREKLFWVWLSIVSAQLADQMNLKFNLAFKTRQMTKKI
jgi:O-antigen ligase